jgi:hypothetical protein
MISFILILIEKALSSCDYSFECSAVTSSLNKFANAIQIYSGRNPENKEGISKI